LAILRKSQSEISLNRISSSLLRADKFTRCKDCSTVRRSPRLPIRHQCCDAVTLCPLMRYPTHCVRGMVAEIEISPWRYCLHGKAIL